MNGVVGMAGLLLDTPQTEEQREMGHVLQSSAENLLGIINDILDFSKIEAGKFRIDPGDFELRPAVEEILAMLAERAYDAVLMDCQMPVIDGYEATRRIRSGSFVGVNPCVPVIAVTAYAMPDDRAKCDAARMNAYVSKPVRADELIAALLQCGLSVSPVPTAVASAPMAVEAVLDLAVLEHMRGLPGRSGPSLLPELVALFVRVEPVRLDEMTRLVEARRAGEIAHLAHLMAGSCATLGAHEMRNAALKLEAAAGSTAGDEVAARLAAVRAAWKRLERELVRRTLVPVT